MTYREQIDEKRLPRHIAIVMDGNGRWAKAQGKERVFGHTEGAESVNVIVEEARRLGIAHLTLYTFSTENFNRPAAEVSALMSLLVDSIHRETERMIQNDIRGHIVGDLSKLPPDVQQTANEFMRRTAHCKTMNLVLAIGYSARWEITKAAADLAQDVANGKVASQDIDEKCFASYLSMAAFPDPDLVIRTGGDFRISNFLLWQVAYAEWYFTPVAWPAFREEAFHQAIVDYQSRERRFGKTSEQIKHESAE